MQLPNQKDRKQSNHKVLNSADNSNSNNDRSLVLTAQLVLESPRDVEDVEESICRVACECDEEDEGDPVYGAKHDGSPDPIHKSNGERSGNAAIEAQNRYLDHSRTDHIIDLHRHCDLDLCEQCIHGFLHKSSPDGQ